MRKNTPNSRLRVVINDLEDPIEVIAIKTGIPKRTLYNLFEDGATIKSDYLIALNEIYGIDPTAILIGSEKNYIRFKKVNDADQEQPEDQRRFSTEGLTDEQKAAAYQFERSVSDLVYRVKEGPYSQGLKLQLLDTLLQFLDEKIDELPEPSHPNQDVLQEKAEKENKP